MNQTIDQYYLERAENLSFIELKKDYEIKEELVLKADMPIPIVIDDLVRGVKLNEMIEHIEWIKIADGMLYSIGVDQNMKYRKVYENLLYSYDSEIENYSWKKGIEMVQNGQLDDGIIYLRAATFLDITRPDLYYTLAFAYEEKAKSHLKNKEIAHANLFVTESTRIYEHILNIDEAYSLAYYKLGYHYYQNNLYIKAQLMWEKYLVLATDENLREEVKVNLKNIKDEVTYETGYTKILSGNVDGGLEDLKGLEEHYPGWWNLHFMLGLAHRQLGEFQVAIEKFERVLMLKPHQIDAINELGLCYVSLNQNLEAIEQFDKILQTEPNNAEILCNRGVAYLQMGENRRARADFEQASEIAPDDPIVRACMNEIERIMN
ncbi:MAG: tetratricopeptide repeat protein [Tissierellales bacterium]|jgi:tetratricopeptide (TPR) repeat protein|nr:tetratricopeptide repeat protein [Tissierellales bacterium]